LSASPQGVRGQYSSKVQQQARCSTRAGSSTGDGWRSDGAR
jgi:hypothetical protein